MTIDEAIEHAKEVASTCDDHQCAAENIQLAEWLRQARGADKAARWYTEKIRELENRSKAFETLFGEKEAENAKLRELVSDYSELVKHLHECVGHDDCDGCEYADDACDFEYDMRELGIEVDG